MIPAPILDDVMKHRSLKNNVACCILIAPRSSCLNPIDIEYLHDRSGRDVYFYCAGYGGYWNRDLVPDMEELEAKKELWSPWAFSSRLFAAFVDELEHATDWEYSGGTELILLGPQVDFASAVVLKIDAMVEDHCLCPPAEVFEIIMRYCRRAQENPSAFSFSDLQVPGIGFGALLELLPPPVRHLWKVGRHYAVRDLSRRT